MKRKLSVEITEEQYQALMKIPWGVKTSLFGTIIADLLHAINNIGPAVIGHLVSRRMRLRDVSDIMPEAEDFKVGELTELEETLWQKGNKVKPNKARRKVQKGGEVDAPKTNTREAR